MTCLGRIGLRLGVVCSLLVIGAGCQQARPANVSVALDESLRDRNGVFPPVEVDLVGVSAADLPRWKEQTGDVDNYFMSSNLFRGTARPKVLNLGPRVPSDSLAADDGQWNLWLGQEAAWLVILSDYPASRPPGPTDARRLILPLDGKRDMHLRVTRNGLVSESPH